MASKGQLDLKTWKGIRSVLQAQLVIAFIVAVFIMKQWWFCVLMIAIGGLLSMFRGKIWCGMLCPNGGFIDLLWSRISLQLVPFPRWLNKGRVLQGLFLAGMLAYFGWIVWLVNIHKGMPVAFASYEAHGILFLRFCQFMLALAAVMALIFEPRSFCAHVCPGGTLGSIMAIARKKSPVVMDTEKCIGCGKCKTVCDLDERLLDPMIARAKELKEEGGSETLSVSPECYGCMDCVAICPTGALRIETVRNPTMASCKTCPAVSAARELDAQQEEPEEKTA
ncbi:MAG: 4Fe-4S dicluster domain-containing protein [Synergistales bacterium]|nr:4Fe-4S dicluster domain-containing protein [Synergistales bacterium]